MKVYFIAGLGANEKAFGFLDLRFCEPVFIRWITPLRAETLAAYAMRLRQCIPEAHPIVAGVSFGGMLVTEMAKCDPLLKGIIISSNKTAKEFPAYLRMWKHLPVYKWVPDNVIKFCGHLTRRLVGPAGTLEQAAFTEILNDTHSPFTVWAIDAILHWQNQHVPANIIHIHGASDPVLPLRFVTATHVIKNGSHLMIMDKAEELSRLLKNIVEGFA